LLIKTHKIKEIWRKKASSYLDGLAQIDSQPEPDSDNYLEFSNTKVAKGSDF